MNGRLLIFAENAPRCQTYTDQKLDPHTVVIVLCSEKYFTRIMSKRLSTKIYTD